MQTLTFDQLRIVASSGGVFDVALKAEGAVFVVNIAMRTGHALLAKARSNEPRHFRNPFQAMTLLRGIGIVAGAYDISQYTPDAIEKTRIRPDRAEALKRTHQAAAYDQWFRAQAQEALLEADNPATSWSTHEEVKNDMKKQRQSLKMRSSKA